MPSIPNNVTFSGKGPDILNAIRNDAGAEYQRLVPAADGTIPNLYEIGKAIYNYKPNQNAFINALLNRIAMTWLSSRLYYNPLQQLKRGTIEFGESVAEYFVELCKPQMFNPSVAEKEVFKRVIPDVRSAFHVMNSQIFYKQTISNDQLRQAFLSYQGVEELISGIVNSMYTSANYDEYLIMKYLVQKAFLNGEIATKSIASIAQSDKTDLDDALVKIRALSGDLQFMKPDYTAAGVHTFTPLDQQIVMLDTVANATVDVKTLAGAFNMEYTDFLAQRILIDSFSTADLDRLDYLFENDPNYARFTPEQQKQLKQIQMITFDRDWFMIFDNLQEFTEIYNNEGLYWNYTYHLWRTFSYSPFKNAVAFVTPTGDEGITGVTVNPAAASASQGTGVQFTAQTTGVEPYDHSVTWSLSTNARAAITSTINQQGQVFVAPNEQNDMLYVVATSNENPAIKGTAALTVTAMPSVIDVTVTPNTVTLQKGDDQQFRAVVDVVGGADTGVTWTLIGNLNGGTKITPQGLLTIAAGETATSLIVRATSQANPSVYGQATVTVVDVPEVTGVKINGYANSTIEQQVPSTVTLTAEVTGQGAYNRGVQWQLVTAGSSGTTLVPSQANPLVATLTIAANETQNVVVSCTSQQDATKSALITVKPYTALRVLINGQLNGTQDVTITPTSGNQAITMTAEVLGGPENTIRDNVQWTLPNDSEFPSGVTVTKDAAQPLKLVLNVASNAVAIDDVLTFTATTMTTPGVSSSFTVHITTPETITIIPATNTVNPGGATSYTAHMYGYPEGTKPTWSITANTTGVPATHISVDANGGVNVDPICPAGNYTVTAQSPTNSAVKATANLTVNRMPNLIVDPTSLTFRPNNRGMGVTITYNGGLVPPLNDLECQVINDAGELNDVTVTPTTTGMLITVPDTWTENKTFKVVVTDLQSVAEVNCTYIADVYSLQVININNTTNSPQVKCIIIPMLNGEPLITTDSVSISTQGITSTERLFKITSPQDNGKLPAAFAYLLNGGGKSVTFNLRVNSVLVATSTPYSATATNKPVFNSTTYSSYPFPSNSVAYGPSTLDTNIAQLSTTLNGAVNENNVVVSYMNKQGNFSDFGTAGCNPVLDSTNAVINVTQTATTEMKSQSYFDDFILCLLSNVGGSQFFVPLIVPKGASNTVLATAAEEDAVKPQPEATTRKTRAKKQTTKEEPKE